MLAMAMARAIDRIYEIALRDDDRSTYTAQRRLLQVVKQTNYLLSVATE